MKSTSAVVIPVVNEGKRITRLLRRMQQLGIHEFADIIIVDGNSTDHSTEETGLRALKVNTLLTYRGSAGLSAQLQVGYSHCLRTGYREIVTIDGNDKDDPEAIPRFIAKLREGYDFVQGSRFHPAGAHENTPLFRFLAVRLIHAPMLSLASGFPWTDTTQGFRGYSERLLRDDTLAIFRSVFKGYSLLAYISYRAPKVGLRVTEIGTRRRYPAGKVPTKLHGVRSKARLLQNLISVVIGEYNPTYGEDTK